MTKQTTFEKTVEFCGIDGKSNDEENGYDIAQRALKDIERIWENE